MRHRTTAALAVGGVLLALSGCSDSGDSDQPTAQQPPGAVAPPAATGPGAPAPAAASTTPAGPPAPVAIGQPVTITRGEDSIELTAVKIVDPATGDGTNSALAPTQRLVAVQWRIGAPGTKTMSEYPGAESGVYDDQGQRYPAEYFRKVTAGPRYPDGAAVAPGDHVVGYIAYVVPKDAKITKVQFAPGLGLAANTATWTL
ncbi:hypothetical protein [Embleya sp. NPDC005971]|uniref:hypothetical protein n=1 Tax=Embleya sp. NPDC005971 TaxID=3156724 RepID=UPI0033F53785